MHRFSIVHWLRNVSIARKLYFTVGLMALLIAIELFTLQFAVRTLSSVRALVGAEGLWSKAQKDAAYSLQKYGRTHDEKDYRDYLDALRVPLGDRKTRLELLKPEPDMQVARRGFLEGKIHPDDIDGAIKLFRRFYSVSYINEAARLWGRGDSLINHMIAIGDRMHREITSGRSTPQSVNLILADMDPLNYELTQLEDEFSFTLGEGSRWLTDLILKLLLALVLTVEISGLAITIMVSRGISNGLNTIIGSASEISKGDYSTRAKVYSKDEIGVLAMAFNDMAAKLQGNIQELQRRKQELKTAKEQAEQSVVVKDHFLANMSHEIRTPMNAVIGFTHLLEATELDERQKEFVRSIKLSGNNLMSIINNILDYSKLESGKMELEQIPFNIVTVIDSVAVLQTKAAEKGLALKWHIDAHIPRILAGDPARLTQVLLNLTDNALKFTEQGQVVISVLLLNEDERTVTLRFDVADTGKGIPADKLSLIFERFTQESADTNRRYGGTGLGLSIAKSLVELQNGTMSVTSEQGMGSTFSFVLSYNKADINQVKENDNKDTPEAVQLVPQNEPVAVKPLKILLAEDNKVNQSLAKHILKKFGFEADVADNGKIAVEKLKQQQYDLVLMDMQMPEMDGYEATTIIRHELKSDIPIIALTAHAMSEEKEKCLSLGMNDFVSKPFDLKDLYAKITQFFT